MADTKISALTVQATIASAHMSGVDGTPTNKKFPGYAFWGEKGASVASAATLTLGDDGNYFHITGSTGPITDIDFTTAKDGRMAVLEFDSTPTITHNGTTLNLPGGKDITVAAGDRMIVAQDSGDNIHVVAFIRAGGSTQKGPDVILEDQKAAGNAGGTFTSGADQTRTLNTEVYDPFGYCTLASNQFTLVAGTWYIKWTAPAALVNVHQSLLYNVTDTAEVKRGMQAFSPAAASVATTSEGSAVVTITASKAFEIRHRCNTTRSTDGFGVDGTFSTNVFCRVEAWKMA